MFSCALPAAAPLAMVNNFIEIRSDLYKLAFTVRRVPSAPADGIGPWRAIITVLSIAGILVNLLVLAFTSDILDDRGVSDDWKKLAIVAIVEHAALLFKFGLAWLIPDVPRSVLATIARDDWTYERARERAAGKPAEEKAPMDTLDEWMFG